MSGSVDELSPFCLCLSALWKERGRYVITGISRSIDPLDFILSTWIGLLPSTLDMTWQDHGILYSNHDAKSRARQCDGVPSDASLGPTVEGISIVILRISSWSLHDIHHYVLPFSVELRGCVLVVLWEYWITQRNGSELYKLGRDCNAKLSQALRDGD